MSATLEPVFSALGYETPAQQRSLIKLLQAAGAFGKLPGVDGVVNDRQADAILKGVHFDDVKQAAEWLHDLTQETMKRPEGQARSDTPERADFTANRAELIQALKEAGVLSEAKPRLKKYDHVLLLGSKESTAETRFNSLKQLWEEGIRFDKIHLLGNERHLDKQEEPIAAITGENGGTLSTETEMLKAQFYEMRNHWPDSLKQVDTYAVNSFNRPMPGTERTRPANTKETIETWLNANPEPDHGNVLVISNQPFVAYQDAAVKSVLPARFHVDTVGSSIDEQDVNIVLAMDSLARQIDVNYDRMLEKAMSQPMELSGSLAMLDPSNIKADPKTYQFRADYESASGVTQKGRFNVDKWDPILHGDPLLVHERLDGSYYVADGHHRLELAQRLNGEGKGPGKLAAIVLREADGYTPEDVKIIAAYKNIAYGKNDPVEAARVFKEAYSGTIHTELLPQLQMDKGNLRLAYTLSGLSDKALDSVAKGEVPVEMAAEIASRVSDPHSQEAVMKVVNEQLHSNHAPEAQAKPFAERVGQKKMPELFAERERRPDTAAKSFAEQLTARHTTPTTPAIPTR